MNPQLGIGTGHTSVAMTVNSTGEAYDSIGSYMSYAEPSRQQDLSYNQPTSAAATSHSGSEMDILQAALHLADISEEELKAEELHTSLFPMSDVQETHSGLNGWMEPHLQIDDHQSHLPEHGDNVSQTSQQQFCGVGAVSTVVAGQGTQFTAQSDVPPGVMSLKSEMGVVMSSQVQPPVAQSMEASAMQSQPKPSNSKKRKGSSSAALSPGASPRTRGRPKSPKGQPKNTPKKKPQPFISTYNGQKVMYIPVPCPANGEAPDIQDAQGVLTTSSQPSNVPANDPSHLIHHSQSQSGSALHPQTTANQKLYGLEPDSNNHLVGDASNDPRICYERIQGSGSQISVPHTTLQSLSTAGKPIVATTKAKQKAKLTASIPNNISIANSPVKVQILPPNHQKIESNCSNHAQYRHQQQPQIATTSSNNSAQLGTTLNGVRIASNSPGPQQKSTVATTQQQQPMITFQIVQNSRTGTIEFIPVGPSNGRTQIQIIPKPAPAKQSVNAESMGSSIATTVQLEQPKKEAKKKKSTRNCTTLKVPKRRGRPRREPNGGPAYWHDQQTEVVDQVTAALKSLGAKVSPVSAASLPTPKGAATGGGGGVNPVKKIEPGGVDHGSVRSANSSQVPIVLNLTPSQPRTADTFLQSPSDSSRVDAFSPANLTLIAAAIEGPKKLNVPNVHQKKEHSSPSSKSSKKSSGESNMAIEHEPTVPKPHLVNQLLRWAASTCSSSVYSRSSESSFSEHKLNVEAKSSSSLAATGHITTLSKCDAVTNTVASKHCQTIVSSKTFLGSPKVTQCSKLLDSSPRPVLPRYSKDTPVDREKPQVIAVYSLKSKREATSSYPLLHELSQSKKKVPKEDSALCSVAPHVQAAINYEQNRVLAPDFSRSFDNMRDASIRLLPYHVFQDMAFNPDFLEKEDEEFETQCEKLTRSSDSVFHRFKCAMFKDSMKEAPSSDMALLARLTHQSAIESVQEAKIECERLNALKASSVSMFPTTSPHTLDTQQEFPSDYMFNALPGGHVYNNNTNLSSQADSKSDCMVHHELTCESSSTPATSHPVMSLYEPEYKMTNGHEQEHLHPEVVSSDHLVFSQHCAHNLLCKTDIVSQPSQDTCMEAPIYQPITGHQFIRSYSSQSVESFNGSQSEAEQAVNSILT